MPSSQDAITALSELKTFVSARALQDSAVYSSVWGAFQIALSTDDESRDQLEPIPYFIGASRYLYYTEATHNGRCEVMQAIMLSWEKVQYFTTADDLTWLKERRDILQEAAKVPIYQSIRPTLLRLSYFFIFIHLLKIMLTNSSNDKILLLTAFLCNLTFRRVPEARQVPPALPDWVTTQLSEKMQLSSSTRSVFRL